MMPQWQGGVQGWQEDGNPHWDRPTIPRPVVLIRDAETGSETVDKCARGLSSKQATGRKRKQTLASPGLQANGGLTNLAQAVDPGVLPEELIS